MLNVVYDMIVGYGDDTSFCEVCNMEFPDSPDEYVIYNKHKNAMKTLEPNGSQIVCALCHMLVANYECLDAHKVDQKHMKKKKALAVRMKSIIISKI